MAGDKEQRAWIHDARATLRRDLRLLREEGYNSQTLGVIERLLTRADVLLAAPAPSAARGARPPPGSIVTCEHCEFPHTIDDDGTRCRFPKLAASSPSPRATPDPDAPRRGNDESRARCTGLTATWCPVHGDCTCERGKGDLDAPACPLHRFGSEHAPDPATTRTALLVELWDAINYYATTCGGDPSARTVSVRREQAVVDVERAIRAMEDLPAPSPRAPETADETNPNAAPKE